MRNQDQQEDLASWLATHGVTRRETEVLHGVARRLSNAEIAAALGISKRTVESHISSLLTRLRAGSRAALIALGASLGDLAASSVEPARPPVAKAGSSSPAVPAVRRTPLAGRGMEMAGLLGHFEGMLGGRGRLVVLSGEPGVGKTRLTEELGIEARRRGARVFVGNCYEAEGTAPYSPFVEAIERALTQVRSPATIKSVLAEDAPEIACLLPGLRRYFPDIGPAPALPAQQARRYLFNGVRATLTRLARATPVVLVLEDLHWADEATLLLLEHLAEHCDLAPVLIVATHRDSYADMWPLLGRTLERLVRRRLVHRMQAGCLDEAGVGAMMTALTGQVPPEPLLQQIHADTEGNPFFVEETLRFLDDEGRLFDAEGRFRTGVRRSATDLPGNIRLVIGRRLERVSPETRRILGVAAVIGRFFDVGVLERTVNGPGQPTAHARGDTVLTALDEATFAGLVGTLPADDGGDRFGFVHTLIQQALLAGLPTPRRRRIHLRVAEAMIAGRAGKLDEHAAEIAFHLAEGDDPGCGQQLLHYSLLAGRRALKGAAFEDAFVHLQRAAALEAVALPSQQAELFGVLGTAHISLGRVDHAIDAWQRALAEYEASDDQEAMGRVCVELGFRLTYAARLTDAAELTRRGLAALGDRVSADRTRLLARLGLITSYAGDPVGGDSMFEEALALADQVGDETVRCCILGDIAGAYYGCLRIAEAVAAGLRGVEPTRRAGDLWTTGDILWPVVWGLACLGRLDESAALSDELEPLAERINHHPAIVCGRRGRAVREFFRSGDLDAYAAFARLDLELLTERLQGAWVGTSYAFIGHAEFLRGDWDAAGAWFARGPVHTESSLAGVCTGAWLLYLAYSGRRADAVALAEQLRAELPVPGRPNRGGAWALLLACTEGLFVLGRRDEPAAWYPLVVEAGRVSGAQTANFAPLQLFERVAGIAATAAGRWEDAERHFRLGIAQADETPHQVERFETRRFYAQMLAERDGAGDRDQARLLLSEALDGFVRLGMPRHADLVRSALAELR